MRRAWLHDGDDDGDDDYDYEKRFETKTAKRCNHVVSSMIGSSDEWCFSFWLHVRLEKPPFRPRLANTSEAPISVRHFLRPPSIASFLVLDDEVIRRKNFRV